MCVFKAGYGMYEVELHVKGQAGRDSVGVVLVGVQAFGLEENLV